MEPAIARTPAPAPVPAAFTDGLGERYYTVVRDTPLEVLTLRDELAAVSSFEFALRERVSRLASFQHEAFGKVLGVERLDDRSSTLGIVSEHVAGDRLSQILTVADQQLLSLEMSAAVCLIRQLVSAVAALHERVPDVCHGAISPERVIVTPEGRLVVVEHVLGAALEQLRYSHQQYWVDLRVALPRSAGVPRFDRRADVTQIGAVALALILGRPIADDEYPSRVGELAGGAMAVSASGGVEPLSSALRSWLFRALQLDPRSSFGSAPEARTELESLLGHGDRAAEMAALRSFLARYHAHASAESAASSASYEAPGTAQPPRPRTAATASPSWGGAEVVTPAAWGGRETAPSSVVSSDTLHAAAPSRVTTPQPGPDAPADAPMPYQTSDPAAAPLRGGTAHESAPAAFHAAPEPARPDPALTRPATPPAAPAAAAAAPIAPPPGVPAGKSAPGGSDPVGPVRPEDFFIPRPNGAPDVVPKAAARAGRSGHGNQRLIMMAAAVVVLAGGGFMAWRMLAPSTAAAVTGTLSVNTNPVGAQVYIDGQAHGATPVDLALPPGAHTLEVVLNGERRTIPVTIAAGAQVSQFIEMPEGPADVGKLMVRTEPAGAKVSVDGQAVGTSPITVERLTPGAHTVVLESDMGSVTHEVMVEAGVTASLVVSLAVPQGAPVSGWIAVNAPADVQVFENGRLIGSSRSDRIMVSAGRHQLEITNEALGYRSTHVVQVAPGRVSSINLDWPKGTLAVNAVPWAEVWLGGDRLGETPIGGVTVPVGSHEVVFRHPELGERRVNVLVRTGAPARVSVDLRR